MKTKLVYLGIRGSVVAVDGATGRELWARALKGSDEVTARQGARPEGQ